MSYISKVFNYGPHHKAIVAKVYTKGHPSISFLEPEGGSLHYTDIPMSMWNAVTLWLWSQPNVTQEVIDEWLRDDDYYVHTAAVAMSVLNAMYGMTLNRKDVDRVIESLQAFKQHLPETYEDATKARPILSE